MKKSFGPPETVTLAKIARAAGVSSSTVSRILNGTARVSAEKQRAVEEAVQRYNYRPNVLARSLASGRTDTIGVLTQDIASPFYGEWLRGIEDELTQTGRSPLFASGHWNAADEQRQLENLLARCVDGVIVLHGFVDPDYLRAYSERVPVVMLGRPLDPSPRLVCLGVDNRQGAYDVVTHLIELGHRRIAHISGHALQPDSEQRLIGYREALADAGIPYDDTLIERGNFEESGGLVAMERLLDAGVSFSAVFASNDQTAYGARLALYRRHVRVPDDVSLVGFDDLPGSLYLTPPLTTVRQPIYEIGRMAADAMARLLRGEAVPTQIMRVELIERETTARIGTGAAS
ncbi:LacI family DNA-binding transcriptional regulator [Pararobbsia silviterrae]|uniref:LacI family DNA-binding transcriptional regulator n=1 Tax=Pararobbsia silviterrae TaxID=1792498 RepID=A0A494YG02_9BURK|nr:substrate-binding domain-containing protein [Pararobbsia silviterrae]RKP58967.1 LacI family DNA-binding transcriptional regulator [Pararobbsia silviterrae]